MRVYSPEQDLSLLLDAPRKEGIPTERLSQGTLDQLYFSLRVALARALSGGHELPLILDDPFVNFDDERLERALQALDTISERTQVILFSCD